MLLVELIDHLLHGLDNAHTSWTIAMTAYANRMVLKRQLYHTAIRGCHTLAVQLLAGRVRRSISWEEKIYQRGRDREHGTG